MRKIKVNIYLFTLQRTGGIRILLEYGMRLQKIGYDVFIYYSLFPYKHYKRESIIRYLRRFRESIFYLTHKEYLLDKYNNINVKLKFAPKISNLFIRKSDFHLFSYWPIAYKLNRMKIDKTKICYLIQAYEIWDSDIDLLHKTYSLGFINCVTSRFLADLIYEKTGAKSEILFNGIDYEIFRQKDITNEKGIITIGFVYYDNYFKGTGVIISALDIIHREFPEKVRIICLSNTYVKDKRDFIKYVYNPDDNQISTIYSQCDIFISASIEEGFYLVPAEVMACGTLSLTTPVGAVPDYSEDNQSAIYFEQGNVQDLVNKLKYLLANEKEIKRISNNGFNKIREVLSWEKSINKLKSYIDQK